MEPPSLGWLDVCIRVKDFAASQAFYESLGFMMVEGDLSQEWGVFVRENARIGLFGAQYMGEDAFSLNFRGGDISQIVNHLGANGYLPKGPPTLREGKAGSARFLDPDGNLVFFDSSPEEAKLNP